MYCTQVTSTGMPLHSLCYTFEPCEGSPPRAGLWDLRAKFFLSLAGRVRVALAVRAALARADAGIPNACVRGPRSV